MPLVLLFDGTCGFCTRSVRWLEARDRRGRIRAVPNQDPGVTEGYGLTREQVDREAWAIDDLGRKWSGAAAANRALRQLDGMWPLVGALYALPPLAALERAIYRWVARNRYWLSDIWGAAPPYGDESGCCS